MWRLMMLLAALSVSSCGKQPSYVASSSADGEKLLHPCTRNAPEVHSYWTPDNETLVMAEQSVHQISQLDARIDPDVYFRQYVGVRIADKPMLYVNAVATEVVDVPRGARASADRPIDICDGGYVSWGALYDPESKRFVGLEINDVGG